MKLSAFTLRGFRKPGEVINQTHELSVREMYLAFEERIAYTTLMTTLDRLHKKGLLARRKQGRAFRYSPRVSPEQFEEGIARGIIDALLGRQFGSAEPVLACIVEAVTDRDRTLLDDLDRLIKEKRRQLKREV
jgi:predicted transcriptional regulator